MNRECGFGALAHLPFTGLLNWDSGQQIRFSFPETSTNPRTGETAQPAGRSCRGEQRNQSRERVCLGRTVLKVALARAEFILLPRQGCRIDHGTGSLRVLHHEDSGRCTNSILHLFKRLPCLGVVNDDPAASTLLGFLRSNPGRA